MGRDDSSPLIDDLSAGYLVGVINRVAASFDVAALSTAAR